MAHSSAGGCTPSNSKNCTHGGCAMHGCKTPGKCSCSPHCTCPPPLCVGHNKVPTLKMKAPYFKGKAIVEGQIKDISLDDYKGKYLVLFFYPHDFSFVCPTEIVAFSDDIEQFKKLNCEVVAASTDSVYCHIEWIMRPREEGGLGAMKIPIIGDVSKKIASSYGALVETEEDLSVACRATYIIDDNQILRVAHVQDTPIGRSTSEIKRLVEAIIFHKQHGEVCPANWKPGDEGVKVPKH